MAEEKNKEMSPTEDGTKVPLSNDKSLDEEAKYVANENGDAKIDIGTANAFAGLTKEELMKYSNDPFWVRLRWFLFLLFWAGWVAMLVMAIVIIIRAPGCEPPPVRLWAEEGALYEVNTRSLPSGEDIIPKMENINVKNVYLPGLISESNYNNSNYDADALIKALNEKQKMVVTDLPSKFLVGQANDLYQNAVLNGLIDSSGNFNYSNGNLTDFVVKNVLNTWMNRGVKGFLLPTINSTQEKFIKTLNEQISGENGAVSGRIYDLETNKNSIRSTPQFKEYLMEHTDDWAFYKFNPMYEASSLISEYEVRLRNMAMFAFKGTPVLLDIGVSSPSGNMTNMSNQLLKELSKFRSSNAFKFGGVSFINDTSDDVIGFTRVRKGTPAFAIALNFGNENQKVSFNGTENISDEGTVKLASERTSLNTDSRKVLLNDVELKPLEGLIIEFVANF